MVGASRGRDADHGDRDEPGDTRDALLTPDAIPASPGPASLSTVVVSGATVNESATAKPTSGGKQVGPVVRDRRAGARARAIDTRGEQRPRRHEEPRAEPHRETADVAREDEHPDRQRHRREARLERRVAGDLLQEERQEEAPGREAAVDGERLDVRDREVAAAGRGAAAASASRSVTRRRRTRRAAPRRRRSSPRPPGRSSRAAAAR